MVIDWNLARQVGGIGFGLVFLVLITLTFLTWLFGAIAGRLGSGKDKTRDEQKGA